MYLIGTKFDLFTDHKALEVTFTPTSKPPACIEHWALQLQQYDFTVRYHKGEANLADVLSRMPLPTSRSKQNVADEYVNFIAANAVPKSMTLQEIEQATQSDQQLQAVITTLKTGQWHPDIQRFYHSHSELTATETNLLLHGTHIVMPQALCSQTPHIAHQGHQGIVKTKRRETCCRLSHLPSYWSCYVSYPHPNVQTAHSSLPFTSYGFLWSISHGRNAVRGDRRVFPIS